MSACGKRFEFAEHGRETHSVSAGRTDGLALTVWGELGAMQKRMASRMCYRMPSCPTEDSVGVFVILFRSVGITEWTGRIRWG